MPFDISRTIRESSALQRIIATGACIIPCRNKVAIASWKDLPAGSDHFSGSVWESATGYGIAPTDGGFLVIIDVDCPKTLKYIFRTCPKLTKTLRTGKDGKAHLYIRCKGPLPPRTIPAKNGRGETASFRGVGSYGLGAGSQYEDGSQYTIVSEDAPIIWVTSRFLFKLHSRISRKFGLPSAPPRLAKPSIEFEFDGTHPVVQAVLATQPHLNGAVPTKDRPLKICCPFHDDRNPSATLTKGGMIFCHAATCVGRCHVGSDLSQDGGVRRYFTKTVARLLGVANPDIGIAGGIHRLYLPGINSRGKRDDSVVWGSEDFITLNLGAFRGDLRGVQLQSVAFLALLHEDSKLHHGKHTYTLQEIRTAVLHSVPWHRRTLARVIQEAIRMGGLQRVSRGVYKRVGSGKFSSLNNTGESRTLISVPRAYLLSPRTIRDAVFANHLVVNSDHMGVCQETFRSLGNTSPIPVSASTALRSTSRVGVPTVNKTFVFRQQHGSSNRGSNAKGDVFRVERGSSFKLTSSLRGEELPEALPKHLNFLLSSFMEKTIGKAFNTFPSGGDLVKGIIKPYFIDCVKIVVT